jgi:hypothetical protein
MAYYAIPARTGLPRQDRTNRRKAARAFQKRCAAEDKGVQIVAEAQAPVHICFVPRGRGARGPRQLSVQRFRALYMGECEGCKYEAGRL